MNKISTEFVTKRQGYQQTVLGTIGVVSVRAQVYVDSYRDQCRARLEVWAPADLRWNLCTTAASEIIYDQAPSYALPKDKPETLVRQRQFCDAVIDQLVRDAEHVLGVTV